MGCLWYGGLVVYGAGADGIGGLGSVLGWPAFTVAQVLTSNVSGMLAGGWRGTTLRPRRWMALGLQYSSWRARKRRRAWPGRCRCVGVSRIDHNRNGPVCHL